jgi:hypothetical protein
MGCLESPPRLQTLLEEGRRDELLGCFMREVAGLPPDQVELMRSLPALSLVASAGRALAQTRRHLPVRDRALATTRLRKGAHVARDTCAVVENERALGTSSERADRPLADSCPPEVCGKSRAPAGLNQLHRHDLVLAGPALNHRLSVANRLRRLLVLKIEQPETMAPLGWSTGPKTSANVAIQQVLPVGNVPLHHGGSRGLMSCDNVGRGGEGGKGMPFGGVSRTDLRLTTALLTSSSSALSSAESQSIAWRAPSWVTSSHRAQRGVSARAR